MKQVTIIYKYIAGIEAVIILVLIGYTFYKGAKDVGRIYEIDTIYFDSLEQWRYEFNSIQQDPKFINQPFFLNKKRLMIPPTYGVCVARQPEDPQYVRVEITLTGQKLNIRSFYWGSLEYANPGCFSERPGILKMVNYVMHDFTKSEFEFSIAFYSPEIEENAYDLSVKVFNYKNEEMLNKGYQDKGKLISTASEKILKEKLSIATKFISVPSPPVEP